MRGDYRGEVEGLARCRLNWPKWDPAGRMEARWKVFQLRLEGANWGECDEWEGLVEGGGWEGGEGEKEIEEKCAEAIDFIRMFPLSYLSVLLQTQFYTNTWLLGSGVPKGTNVSIFFSSFVKKNVKIKRKFKSGDMEERRLR